MLYLTEFGCSSVHSIRLFLRFGSKRSTKWLRPCSEGATSAYLTNLQHVIQFREHTLPALAIVLAPKQLRSPGPLWGYGDPPSSHMGACNMTTSALSAALVAKGPVTVALTNPHDPAAFYQTRAGLYVYRDFRDHIVRQAKPTDSASPVTLRRFVLERNASDKEIEDELGANHVFTETEVCWIVAEMIGKQKRRQG